MQIVQLVLNLKFVLFVMVLFRMKEDHADHVQLIIVSSAQLQLTFVLLADQVITKLQQQPKKIINA